MGGIVHLGHQNGKGIYIKSYNSKSINQVFQNPNRVLPFRCLKVPPEGMDQEGSRPTSRVEETAGENPGSTIPYLIQDEIHYFWRRIELPQSFPGFWVKIGLIKKPKKITANL